MTPVSTDATLDNYMYVLSQEFLCHMESVRTCKQVMTLCIGNHELYLNRRKVAVAPRNKSQSPSRLTDCAIDEEHE